MSDMRKCLIRKRKITGFDALTSQNHRISEMEGEGSMGPMWIVKCGEK
jgi:hypothetical protein